MLVDIPDDLAETVASAIQSRADWFRRDTGHCPEGLASLRSDADRLDALADGIERRRADLSPTPEVTAATLTEDAVGRLMVQAANVPDAELRTRCTLWLDYPALRGAQGPSLAAEINRRAKAGAR